MMNNQNVQYLDILVFEFACNEKPLRREGGLGGGFLRHSNAYLPYIWRKLTKTTDPYIDSSALGHNGFSYHLSMNHYLKPSSSGNGLNYLV